AIEKRVRIRHQVLVELVIPANERHEACFLAAASASRALVGTHSRPGIAIEKDDIETTHIDTEFERVRTPDPANRPIVKPFLDLFAAILFESGLIGGSGVGEVVFVARSESVSTPVGVALRTLARASEYECLVAAHHEVAEQSDRLGVW